MSCWRVLELSKQPDDPPIPQLLIKPVFHADSYSLHITDLSNIWSEELDLDGIVGRALREQSPVEVSKQDTTQLAILLDNVKNSLLNFKDTTCHITREHTEGIILYSTIKLPEPLDSLKWMFHLEKRTATTLRNELILPLLVSSHIQNERITDLILTIATKDNALDRLVDQYESSNLDLAAAFPSIGRLKSGRRTIKREQAARHITALQPFREEVWREETGQLGDSDVTTLGMFQEALSQCNPEVPPQLKSGEAHGTWWTAISKQISPVHATSKSKPEKFAHVSKQAKDAADSTEDETDDEFEYHEHFNTRKTFVKPVEAPESAPLSEPGEQKSSDDDSTEDDDDLDAHSTSQNQSQSRTSQRSLPHAKSPTPETLPPPESSSSFVSNPKPRGFRIGGQMKKAVTEPSRENSHETPEAEVQQTQESVLSASSQPDLPISTTPRKPRRTFKIGGKGKDGDDSQRSLLLSSQTTHMRSPTVGPASSPPPPPERSDSEQTPVEEVQEETPEQKAERRRAELKRRNGEVAKKQAQMKKKKRF